MDYLFFPAIWNNQISCGNVCEMKCDVVQNLDCQSKEHTLIKGWQRISPFKDLKDCLGYIRRERL